MNFYVIMKNFDKGNSMTCFEENEWKYLKDEVDSERLVYVTKDVSDPEIKKYNIKKVIFNTDVWEKDFNLKKIIVKYSPNYDEMQKEYECKLKKAEKKAEKKAHAFLKKNESEKKLEKEAEALLKIK